MFTAAVFRIAEMWKQSKCPSTDEMMKTMKGVCVSVCVSHSGIFVVLFSSPVTSSSL